MSDDHSWDDDEGVVIKPQLGIAVYCNGSGEIVIRQQSGSRDDDDPFVYFPREHVKKIIAALRRAAAEGK